MKPRGYLLMEAMLGSAVLAVTFAVAADQVGASRRGASYAGHKQTAITLANGKADAAIAGLPTSPTADATTLRPVDAARYPGFTWRWTTTDASAGAAARSVPAIPFTAREVTVVVTFPTEARSLDDRATPPVDDGRASVTISKLWFASPLPR